MFDIREFFCTEEREILNNSVIQKMSRKQLLDDLSLQYEMNGGDEDYASILEHLSNKIKNLSEEEFEHLIACVPLETLWDSEEYNDDDEDLNEKEYKI